MSDNQEKVQPGNVDVMAALRTKDYVEAVRRNRWVDFRQNAVALGVSVTAACATVLVRQAEVSVNPVVITFQLASLSLAAIFMGATLWSLARCMIFPVPQQSIPVTDRAGKKGDKL